MISAPIVQVWDETGTTALGVLAGMESLTVSDVLSDIGSAKLGLRKGVTGVDLLTVDSDRQLRLIRTGAPDMWFLLDEDSFTYVSDDPSTELVDVTCRSIAGLLDEAVVIPSGGVGVAPAEWAFTAATAGKIVADLFASAQSRSLLQGLTLSGNATVDAAGAAWGSTVTTTYRAGTTLLAVLTGLAKNLLIEWRFNGRALEIYKPSGGLDRTLDTALRPGRDVIQAPLQRSRRGVATAVVIEGSSGSTARRTQVVSGRRNRETYISKTELAAGSLPAIGDLYLAAHAAADVQITHDLTGDATGALMPWVDYRPGDRIPTAAASATGVTTRRIQQVVVTWAADGGVTASLELGSLMDGWEARMQRQVAALLPGAETL